MELIVITGLAVSSLLGWVSYRLLQLEGKVLMGLPDDPTNDEPYTNYNILP